MPSLSELLPAAEADVYRSNQGTVSLWKPAPGVMATRVEGILTLGGARAIEALMRRVVDADGRLLSFNDWFRMNDYETASRIQLTRVAGELRPVTDGAHFILRSKIVALGVQAANLALKFLTVHSSEDSFARLLHDTLQQRRRT